MLALKAAVNAILFDPPSADYFGVRCQYPVPWARSSAQRLETSSTPASECLLGSVVQKDHVGFDVAAADKEFLAVGRPIEPVDVF